MIALVYAEQIALVMTIAQMFLERKKNIVHAWKTARGDVLVMVGTNASLLLRPCAKVIHL